MKLPKYVHGYIDRHGHARHYVRRAGQKSVTLPGIPWTPEFMAAYEAALRDAEPIALGAGRTVPGSVDMAAISYYASPAFAALAPGTQRNRRSLLERFRADHGSKRVGLMDTRALQVILGKMTPANQRNFKKALRGLVEHCLAKGWIKTDPLVGLKTAKLKSAGHHTWDDGEVELYRKHHAPGSRARLALELLLQTGVARADLVKMGRQFIRGGMLSMQRQKTNVRFDIPLLPELVAELERHPKTGLVFLTTENGGAYTPTGFGKRFRKWCAEAGLPDACTAHGLRKASAVRHALNGATAAELMAWHGWRTIGEAQRYVEEADRIKLAKSAGAKIIARTTSG
jgi:site-specific recombinase XerD